MFSVYVCLCVYLCIWKEIRSKIHLCNIHGDRSQSIQILPDIQDDIDIPVYCNKEQEARHRVEPEAVDRFLLTSH